MSNSKVPAAVAVAATRLVLVLLLIISATGDAHSFGHRHFDMFGLMPRHHQQQHQQQYQQHTPAAVMVYQRGFTMSIPAAANPEVNGMRFQGTCISPSSGYRADFSYIARQPVNGYWTYVNRQAGPLARGDVIDFRVMASSRQRGVYVCDRQKYTVNDIQNHPMPYANEDDEPAPPTHEQPPRPQEYGPPNRMYVPPERPDATAAHNPLLYPMIDLKNKVTHMISSVVTPAHSLPPPPPPQFGQSPPEEPRFPSPPIQPQQPPLPKPQEPQPEEQPEETAPEPPVAPQPEPQQQPKSRSPDTPLPTYLPPPPVPDFPPPPSPTSEQSTPPQPDTDPIPPTTPAPNNDQQCPCTSQPSQPATVPATECASISQQLGDILQYVQAIEKRTAGLQDKLDVLEEVQVGILTEQAVQANRSRQLLITAPPIDERTALRDVRSIVGERLEMPAMRDCIVSVRKMPDGVVVKVRTVADKLRILFRAQKRANKAQVAVEDYADEDGGYDGTDDPVDPELTLEQAFSVFDEMDDTDMDIDVRMADMGTSKASTAPPDKLGKTKKAPPPVDFS